MNEEEARKAYEELRAIHERLKASGRPADFSTLERVIELTIDIFGLPDTLCLDITSQAQANALGLPRPGKYDALPDGLRCVAPDGTETIYPILTRK